MRLTFGTLPLLLLATFVNAQKETITTRGNTVVVDVTQNAAGNPVTSTISTIAAAAANNPAPFAGQPAATDGPAEPTWYYVTSVDANGDTIVNSYEFTATFAPSSNAVQYPSGTVYNYHSWTSQYATATFIPKGGSSHTYHRPFIGLSVTLSAALAGALLILL